MKNLRIIAGYILIIFPPVYGLRLLLDPEVFSANAPLVVAATLVLVMILSMVFSFGLYLLKKK